VLIVLLGIISGALFYGDCRDHAGNCPVLSAIEGIKLVTAAFDPYVVPADGRHPVSFLFAVQSRGTASVASFFGPIMLVWFLIIGLAALPPIVRHPEVFVSRSIRSTRSRSCCIMGINRLRHARRGVSRRHRRRGAVRRSRPFR